MSAPPAASARSTSTTGAEPDEQDAGWSLSDLPPAVADMLLWSPTAEDALAGAVWLLSGRRLYVDGHGGSTQAARYMVPLDGDRYAAAAGMVGQTWWRLCEEAPDGATIGEQTSACAFSNRRTVEALLRNFRVHHNLTARVGSTGDHSWRAMGMWLAAWWDARMHEGHTAASAATLLSLLATPENVRRSVAVRNLHHRPPGAVHCPPDPSAAPEDWTVQAMHVAR